MTRNYTAKRLQQFKLDAIKSILKNNELSMAGNKPELIERIVKAKIPIEVEEEVQPSSPKKKTTSQKSKNQKNTSQKPTSQKPTSQKTTGQKINKKQIIAQEVIPQKRAYHKRANPDKGMLDVPKKANKEKLTSQTLNQKGKSKATSSKSVLDLSEDPLYNIGKASVSYDAVAENVIITYVRGKGKTKSYNIFEIPKHCIYSANASDEFFSNKKHKGHFQAFFKTIDDVEDNELLLDKRSLKITIRTGCLRSTIFMRIDDKFIDRTHKIIYSSVLPTVDESVQPDQLDQQADGNDEVDDNDVLVNEEQVNNDVGESVDEQQAAGNVDDEPVDENQVDVNDTFDQPTDENEVDGNVAVDQPTDNEHVDANDAQSF